MLLPEDLSCQHPLLLVQGWARAFFDKVDPTAHVQMQEATDADDVRDIRIGIRGSQVLASTKAATGRRRPDRRGAFARAKSTPDSWARKDTATACNRAARSVTLVFALRRASSMFSS